MKQRRIPLIDVGTLHLIRTGDVKVQPGISVFTHRGVIFADGTTDDFDAVILATGYQPTIDTFLAEASTVTDEQGVPRASGTETDVPGLYFCGFTNVPTGLLREIGIEAKRIVQAISRSYATVATPMAGTR